MSIQLKPFSYASLSLEQTLIDLAVRFILNCPPEDLSSPVRLMFQVEEAHWFYLDFARVQNQELPIFKLTAFVQKLYQVMPAMKSIYLDPLAAVTKFSNYKRGIPVRGGIILNEAMDKVLLVRAFKFKSWGFPRGKINKGEDDLVCAVREVYEETGFDMTSYTDRNEYAERTIDGKNFLLFFASGVPESTNFVTRTREEIEEIKWIPLSDVISKPTYKTFLVPAFLKDIERFISKRYERKKAALKKKNASTAPASESTQHSAALKQLLGISQSQPAREDNNDKSSRQLLNMIQRGVPVVPPPTAVNNGLPDLPVLHGPAHIPVSTTSPPTADISRPNDSFTELTGTSTTSPTSKSSSDSHGADMESAKHILALLNREISSESNKNATDATDVDASAAPLLPQNDMLEQLISSRRTRQSRHQSKVPTKKPKLKQNSLLQVLISSNYTKQGKLIDLLKPVSGEQAIKKSSARDKQSLMKLLGESAAPSDTSIGKSPSKAKATEVPGHELMKLLGAQNVPEPELKSNGTEKSSENKDRTPKSAEVPSNELMKLLGVQNTHEPELKIIESEQPAETIDENPEPAQELGHELMKLLGEQSTHEVDPKIKGDKRGIKTPDAKTRLDEPVKDLLKLLEVSDKSASAIHESKKNDEYHLQNSDESTPARMPGNDLMKLLNASSTDATFTDEASNYVSSATQQKNDLLKLVKEPGNELTKLLGVNTADIEVHAEPSNDYVDPNDSNPKLLSKTNGEVGGELKTPVNELNEIDLQIQQSSVEVETVQPKITHVMTDVQSQKESSQETVSHDAAPSKISLLDLLATQDGKDDISVLTTASTGSVNELIVEATEAKIEPKVPLVQPRKSLMSLLTECNDETAKRLDDRSDENMTLSNTTETKESVTKVGSRDANENFKSNNPSLLSMLTNSQTSSDIKSVSDQAANPSEQPRKKNFLLSLLD